MFTKNVTSYQKLCGRLWDIPLRAPMNRIAQRLQFSENPANMNGSDGCNFLKRPRLVKAGQQCKKRFRPLIKN